MKGLPGRKRRMRLHELEKLAATRIKVIWINHYDKTNREYEMLNVTLEHLAYIWKFGEYANAQKWHETMYLGGESYLFLETSNEPENRSASKQSFARRTWNNAIRVVFRIVC
jgi:hypothetical protein